MSAVHELLAANLHRVFGNRDAVSRRVAIDETYAEDVAFDDGEGAVVGREAIEQKVTALLSGVPADFVFAEDGIAYTSADTGVLSWAFGPTGSPVVRGVDIITVRDGLITAVKTLVVPAEH
jgi:hypothetical protein